MLSFQDQGFEVIATVTVTPARAAYFFKSGSIEGFRRAVQEATTRWEGTAELIIPVKKGGVIGSKWLQILQYTQVDGGVKYGFRALISKMNKPIAVITNLINKITNNTYLKNFVLAATGKMTLVSNSPKSDNNNIVFSHETPESKKEVDQTIEAISLLGEVLELLPPLGPDEIFSNDIAARACFVRALQQLYAALHLCLVGFYSEVGVILRANYESASLGRMLAKEPQAADRWIKGSWISEKEVRNWMKNKGFLALSEQQVKDYDKTYKRLSDIAHPTAFSCLGLIDYEQTEHEEIIFSLVPVFNMDKFLDRLKEIQGAALFSCFAFRNAAVAEDAIDPVWREKLYRVAPKITGQSMDHLERNWEKEKEKYQIFRKKVHNASETEDYLKHHPQSWSNLNKE